MTKILGVQTARAGSKSVKNKNIAPIHGEPMYTYNLNAMLACGKIENVVITTDIEDAFTRQHEKLTVLTRPKHLLGDDASHADAIIHAVENMERLHNKEYNYVALTLGNSLGCYTTDLSKAAELLINDPDSDSIMTVSKFNMFNPYRAFKLTDEKLDTFIPQEMIKNINEQVAINDKNSAGDIYFFNGSFMIFKKSCLYRGDGLMPFSWLGKNIRYYIQDTEMEVDALWQLEYLMNR